MSNVSLTKQAALLMAGRMLAMPLAFLVPVFLVRKFSVDEFGLYKQLFLIFNVLLPIVDMGITNSLYYLMPKYHDKKNIILIQSIFVQLFLCILVVFCFCLFQNGIAKLFTKNEIIGEYLPLLGLFVVLWHLSNIIEVVLVVEKKAWTTSIVTFTSEAVRSALSIIIVLCGGGVRDLLKGLVIVGGVRMIFMAGYLFRRYEFCFQSLDMGIFKSQVVYALPFGLAVIINGFVINVHQYIVSVTASVSDFAVFSVACFQLPLLGVVVDSIAKTSLVRMAELRNCDNSLHEIAAVIFNSNRKLWLLFFPIYLFLFIVAEDFISILFTSQYIESVPIFRILIMIIPFSAILIQHVPRAFSETRFILINNIFVLILSVLFCIAGEEFLGMIGVAIGFVSAHFIWKMTFLLKCRNLLHVPIKKMLPLNEMLKMLIVLLPAICGSVLLEKFVIYGFSEIARLLIVFVFFFGFSFVVLWKFNSFTYNEKTMLKGEIVKVFCYLKNFIM